jgi:hypothetical protein
VLALAAHPEESFTWLHKIILRRGKWHHADYRNSRLDALQILNGPVNAAYKRGLKSWTALLLEGRKIFLAAGNDAHGAFNRYRQLRLPFLCFRELTYHVFGKARMAVRIDDSLRHNTLLRALKRGCSSVTTGPLLELAVTGDGTRRYEQGESVNGDVQNLLLAGASSADEFGSGGEVTLWIGYPGEKKERILRQIALEPDMDRFSLKIPFSTHRQACYIRGEYRTFLDGQSYFCLTNPIWISP